MNSEILGKNSNFLPKNLFVSQNLCTFAPAFKTTKHWRDGRVVDYSSLENYRTERYRGFESLSLRQAKTQSFGKQMVAFSLCFVTPRFTPTFGSIFKNPKAGGFCLGIYRLLAFLSSYAGLNFSFGCLQRGQRQSSGRSSKATPSCSAGS